MKLLFWIMSLLYFGLTLFYLYEGNIESSRFSLIMAFLCQIQAKTEK